MRCSDCEAVNKPVPIMRIIGALQVRVPGLKLLYRGDGTLVGTSLALLCPQARCLSCLWGAQGRRQEFCSALPDDWKE